MYSAHTTGPPREPVLVDEFGGRHHPPPTPSNHQKGARRPDFPEPLGRQERRPRRAQTYRAPPIPSSSSSPSSSPHPPQRHQRRHSPMHARKLSPPEAEHPCHDYYTPRERRTREEDYYSDKQHNRPRRDAYGVPPPRQRHQAPPRQPLRKRTRPRDDVPRVTRPAPPRKESKWQKEAKDMFKEYAVPVIKAEGGKYISRQIGNLIAKKA